MLINILCCIKFDFLFLFQMIYWKFPAITLLSIIAPGPMPPVVLNTSGVKVAFRIL